MSIVELLLAGAALVGTLAIYLAIVATVPVFLDSEPVPNKLLQLALIWLFPIAGPLFNLHVMHEVSPSLVPLAKVPWPFRGAVVGRISTPDRERADL